MPPINNAHDHYFRYVFSHPEDAREFLQHSLPPAMLEKIDLARLELQSGSYIDEKLREHLSDILYKVPLYSGQLASIYCLFEHKSWPETSIHLQILRYMYGDGRQTKLLVLRCALLLRLSFIMACVVGRSPRSFWSALNSLIRSFMPTCQIFVIFSLIPIRTTMQSCVASSHLTLYKRACFY